MKLRKLILLPLLLSTLAARAENWAQWRGPFFNGSTTEKNLPETWSETENVIWKTPLPGWSGSTPIVWGDHIFISSPDGQKNLLLLCLNRKNGSVRWQKQLAVGDKTIGKNNMTSPSPVTDGKRVFALFGTGDLAALDFNGKILWQRSLAKDFGRFSIMWLYGGSPLLYRDKLYVQVLQREPHGDYAHALDDHPVRDSYLLCIDPKTGRDLWRQLRKTDAVMESMEAYTTPLPLEINKRREVIVAGGDYVTAHNPDTGEELWRCGGLNLRHEQWWRLVSSPVAVEDLVLACGPKRDPVLAIRDGGKGMVTDTNIAWKSKIATPDVCTPLVYQKKLFVLDGDRQTLASLDPKTGEKQWSGKFSVHETFSASPTGADGKIYCISEAGTVVVADAGDEFKILSTIKLHEENCRASIVASGGQLFVRTGKNLWCVGKK